MRARVIVLIAVAAVFAACGIWGGWMLRYRPLTVFAWQTRFALRGAGLHMMTVAAPPGPQAVFVGGSGPPLVLLHGAGDNAGTWFRLAPDLIRDHTLIVPDLAGHGASAPRSGPIGVKAILDGVEAVVDAVAPGKRAVLVGNSLGAWIAMLEAQRRPARVALVVCIDGGAVRGHNVEARILPRTREQARESVAQTRDPASPSIPGFVLDDIVRQAREGPLARFAATAATMDAFVLDDDQLRRMAVPVSLIWGASDRLVPIDYADRMLAALPHGELVTLEHCGHVPQIECPAKLLHALRKALETDP